MLILMLTQLIQHVFLLSLFVGHGNVYLYMIAPEKPIFNVKETY